MNALKKRIKVSQTYLPVMNMVVAPLIRYTGRFFACYFLSIPGLDFPKHCVADLRGNWQSGRRSLSAAGNSFDVGGPVSKGFYGRYAR